MKSRISKFFTPRTLHKVVATDSVALDGIWVFSFPHEVLLAILDTVKYFLFPLAALMNVVQGIFALRKAWLYRNDKHRRVALFVNGVIQMVTGLVIAVAVGIALAMASAVVPFLFTCALGAKALHAGLASLWFGVVKPIVYPNRSKAEAAEDSLHAKISLFNFAMLAIVTVAAAFSFIAIAPVLKIAGPVLGFISATATFIYAVVTMPSEKASLGPTESHSQAQIDGSDKTVKEQLLSHSQTFSHEETLGGGSCDNSANVKEGDENVDDDNGQKTIADQIRDALNSVDDAPDIQTLLAHSSLSSSFQNANPLHESDVSSTIKQKDEIDGEHEDADHHSSRRSSEDSDGEKSPIVDGEDSNNPRSNRKI